MELMTVKKLKELLDKCDDASHVKILSYYSLTDYNWLDIESVLVEYTKDDDYQIPSVILKTNSEW